MYVFGYGSLMNGGSLQRTIKRMLEPRQKMPIRVNGFARVWNYKSSVFSSALEKGIDAVFLNLSESNVGFINGICFEVNEDELELLKEREKYYELIDVSANIVGKSLSDVYTFICYDSEHLAAHGSNAFVMKKYLDIVKSGCQELGTNFIEEYERTTEQIPFQVIDGDYRFL